MGINIDQVGFFWDIGKEENGRKTAYAHICGKQLGETGKRLTQSNRKIETLNAFSLMSTLKVK